VNGQLRVHAHNLNIVLLNVPYASGVVAIPFTTATVHSTAIEEIFKYHVNTLCRKNAELFKGMPSGKKTSHDAQKC
jgi:hypothetical protein